MSYYTTNNQIRLAMPDVDAWGCKFILKVIQSPNLSLGPMLGEFEKKMAHYLGAKYAVAVNSGTSALHLCIRALNINEGDKVFTSPFSFIASANCMLFERAFPVFVDIDENSLNIDAGKLEDAIKHEKNSRKKLKAILPVHVFGRPCELDDLLDIVKKYHLKLIEDACEAIGAEYLSSSQLVAHSSKETANSTKQKAHGSKVKKTESSDSKTQEVNSKQIKANKVWKKVGTFGDCGVFAFYPNKQITTGEGGMIVTNNKKIAYLCKSMRNQGRSDNGEWLQHDRLGYNYRISDINCALGIAQLSRIDEILSKRANVAKWYGRKLVEIDELILPCGGQKKKISWFVYVVRLLDRFSRKDRDQILSKLSKKGIGCSNYFAPIHLQPFYRKMFGYKQGDFPITEKVSERTVALPFFNNLKEEQVDFVCKTLKQILFTIGKKTRVYRRQTTDDRQWKKDKKLPTSDYRPQRTEIRLQEVSEKTKMRV